MGFYRSRSHASNQTYSMKHGFQGSIKGEQKGCWQRLVWHLSCHRRFPLAVV